MTSCFIPRRNRKGQVGDIGFIIGAIFSFVLVTFVAILIGSTFFHKIQTTGHSNSNVDAVAAKVSVIPTFFDKLLPIIIACMTIGLIITSFLIPSHPIFLVVNIVGMFALAVVSMLFSNVFGRLAQTQVFDPIASQMPFTVYVMNYMPIICVAIVFISTVVMYSKSQVG